MQQNQLQVRPIGHMTYTQAPVMCEKKKIHILSQWKITPITNIDIKLNLIELTSVSYRGAKPIFSKSIQFIFL